MTRGPVEGVHGHDEEDAAPGVKAWNRYLAQQDEAAASERAAKEAAEEEQRLAAQRRPSNPVGGAVAAEPIANRSGRPSAAASLSAGLKAALTETPQQKRMDALAAMQAEALARLEIAPHADQVGAAQRATEHVDEGERYAARDLQEERRLDREEKAPVTEAGKKADARRPAEKYVAPAKKPAAKEPAPKRKPGERGGS
jgi:hypothetical protein